MRESEDDKQPGAGSGERKPYQAPRIEESARFEHLVLNCTFQPVSDECFLDGGGKSTI
jgi:hypothetical protein